MQREGENNTPVIILLFCDGLRRCFFPSIVLLLTAKRLLMIGGKDAKKYMLKMKGKHAEEFTVKFLYTVDQLDRFYR